MEKDYMDKEVVDISEFRFGSLRKYMHPIYARMNRHLHETEEKKREILFDMVPEFYRRMRVYRGLSLEQVAKGSAFSTEELADFEKKKTPPSFAKEMVYTTVCGRHIEFEFFVAQVREFFQPSIKESKRDLALPALKQWGIVMPGVDYKNLHTPRGKILNFIK